MRLPDLLRRIVQVPRVTRLRWVAAIAFALAADGVQLLLGPLGWAFFDEIIDVAMMLITVRLLGFHLLLLPTFVVEFLPIVDMLPTWTGCVIAVIALRKAEQRGGDASHPAAEPPKPPVPPERPCIDI